MRKHILLAILFPLAVFLWMAGWTLFWSGSECSPSQAAIKGELMEIAEPISKHAI